MGMTDKDLYDKAYAYFEYHAGQRTNMINFFIGIFGACIALYGALISSLPLACALISVFLFIVSLVFYFIDIRNKFDVKQSQEVLCHFEKAYTKDAEHAQVIRGVFLHEDYTFLLYDRTYRRTNGDYKSLLRKKRRVHSGALDEEIAAFVKKYPQFSEKDVKASLLASPIPHFSSCIKFLYFLCMGISIIGLAFSVYFYFAG